MTLVRQRVAAIVAMFALIAGCAFVAAAPQQQAYAVDTNLTAGSTFNAATNLALNNKQFASSNKTEFNEKADNNFYKFTTSKRESRYKVTLRSYEGYTLYATIYDSSHHRIAYFKTTSTSGQSWTFKNLKRNSLYYVEVWRFMSDGANYVASGSVLDKGVAESAYPPYKIKVKEVVTKPTLTGFKAESNKNHQMNLSWSDPSYNAENVQVQMWWSWQDNRTTKNTFYRTAKASALKYNTTVKYFGKNRPYQVRVRPYLTANGKRVYGKWSSWKTVKIEPLQIENFKAKSNSKGKMNLSWAPINAKGDRVQIQMWWSWQSKRTSANTFTRTAAANAGSFSTSVKWAGDTHPYKVRMRVYRMDGNKRIYGNWTSWKTVTIKQ